MKTKLVLLSILLCFSAGVAKLRAGTPAQEKAFTGKYKTAFEAKDTVTLESFLYTKDAKPMALGFYKMMMAHGAGGKIAKIELVDLTPGEMKKTERMQDGPGGTKMRLPLKPTKKLRITVETRAGDNRSSSTSESLSRRRMGTSSSRSR